MSVFTDTNIIFGYGAAIERTLDVLSAWDDDFEIISMPTQLLSWGLREKITGYRKLYSVRTNTLSDADREYLYSFCLDASQVINFNSVSNTVRLKNEEVIDQLLQNIISNPSVTLEFADAEITVPSTSFTPGTTHSANYQVTRNGTTVLLTMNYGSGDIQRLFNVLSVNAYGQRLATKPIDFFDRNRDIIRLGRRQKFMIDFGAMSRASETQRQDDRTWIRDFCCAPTKNISVPYQYNGTVINDFSEVHYQYLGDSIYGKAVSLQFIEKDINSNVPVAGQFILDQLNLDTQVLG